MLWIETDRKWNGLLFLLPLYMAMVVFLKRWLLRNGVQTFYVFSSLLSNNEMKLLIIKLLFVLYKLLLFSFFHFFYQLVNVVWFVRIQHAKLYEINFVLVIVIYYFIDHFEITYWKTNSRKFTPCHKLIETHRAIKIEVEVAECSSIIFKLLLDSNMDLSKYLLDLGQRFLWLAILDKEARETYACLKLVWIVSAAPGKHRTPIMDLEQWVKLCEPKLGLGVVIDWLFTFTPLVLSQLLYSQSV